MATVTTETTPSAPPAADARKRAVRIRAGALRGALKDVVGLVGSRGEIPILRHVLLQAGDGRIVLTATDLDAWAVRDVATDDRDGPGSGEWLKSIRPFTVALPARPLEALLGELDADAMVTLSCATAAGCSSASSPADGAEPVTQVTIAAGRSTFRLHCLPPDDFPRPRPFSAHAAFELACTALADAFARVEHAISTEETRYYLNGIYLHPHQEEGEPGGSSTQGVAGALFLRLVTTDGSRLARLRLDPPDGAASFPAAIVRRDTVALLDKLLTAAAKADSDKAGEPARVLVEIDGEAPGAMLRFGLPAADGGEITVTAKSVDGTYPDYQRVIPGAPALTAVVARAPLMEAVKRVGVLASDKTRCVKAIFSGATVSGCSSAEGSASEGRSGLLTLVVATPEIGEAREEVPCAYDGPAVTIGFNGQFWREALAALACDEVAMGFDAGPAGGDLPVTAPVLLRAVGVDVDRETLVQVLMPMRV